MRVLAVPGFSTREALNYLSGRLTTDPDQRSGAIGLAGELGCEPAALAQAAAVIVSSGIRCREYRDYFARRRAQLAAAGAGPLPAAEVTWTLSAEHAGQLAPEGEPGRSLRWPRCWIARRFPGPCSPRLPPASTSRARASRGGGSGSGLVGGAGPGAGRAAGHRRGGHPAGRLDEPGAAGGRPRGSAPGSAEPGRPGRSRCAGRGVARRSAAIVAGRGPAVIRREPAAGHG